MNGSKRLFVKICGITSLEDALECVKAGADALGFVFYPHSPRHIAPEKAGEIIDQLPDGILTFGVFVNTPPDALIRAKITSGIDIVQLHGSEPPEWVNMLGSEGIKVCKAFFRYKRPSFREIGFYSCKLALFESGRSGYGGTGKSWSWPDIEIMKKASDGCENLPVLLAGGISEKNIVDAVKRARPDGIDVSSGVEKYPGKKDYRKVRRLVGEAKRIQVSWKTADFNLKDGKEI